MTEVTTTASSADKKPPTSSAKKALIGIGIFCACAGGAIGGIAYGLSKSMAEGTWLSNWGSYITVTGSNWYSISPWGTTIYKIKTLTNSYAIMQNPSTDAYYPDKWSKVEYHALENGGWGYCISVYNAESADAALNADTKEVYDATDADKGCNGFGHSTVTAFALPIEGEWRTDYDEQLSISSTAWTSKSTNGDSSYKIEAYGVSFVLMQNPEDAEYNPGKWSKVEFHTVGDGFGYCFSVYDGGSAAAALTKDSSNIYDASNGASGCNGFAHTIASK